MSTVRNGYLTVKNSDTTAIEVEKMDIRADQLATGDYYLVPLNEPDSRKRISGNTETEIIISADNPWDIPPEPGSKVEIQVRLQKPYIDIE